jgi:PST family polysaccharide transporter
MDQGDVLLLAYLSNPVQVAFYSVAKKVSYSILLLTDPITNSIYPQLSLLVSAKKYNDIKTMLKKITKVILYPSVGFLILMYFFNEELIQLIYGSEYYGAGLAFFILLVSSVLSAVFFWALSLVLSLGLFRFRLFSSILSLVAGFTLAYYLTPKYGAVGVAAGLLLAKLITLLLSIIVTTRELAG